MIDIILFYHYSGKKFNELYKLNLFILKMNNEQQEGPDMALRKIIAMREFFQK